METTAPSLLASPGDDLQVGDVVRFGREFMRSPPGAVGIVVERYPRSQGDTGVTLLSEHGSYCGFSRKELALWEVTRIGRVERLSNYAFRNVQQLEQDYASGRFESGFLAGRRALTDQAPRRE